MRLPDSLDMVLSYTLDMVRRGFNPLFSLYRVTFSPHYEVIPEDNEIRIGK